MSSSLLDVRVLFEGQLIHIEKCVFRHPTGRQPKLAGCFHKQPHQFTILAERKSQV